MVTLDQLPNEVLYGIVSLLRKKHDVTTLCLVNRHCYNIARSVLWKKEVNSDRPGALHWAIEHDNLEIVQRALEAGVSPSRPGFSHKPKSRIDPKHKWWNFHSTYYDDPSWQDDDEQSVDLDPSYARHDHCNCFEGGCDDGIFNDCAWTPMHMAASKGRIDMIDMLLEKGARIDSFSWGFCLCRPHLPLEAFAQSRVIDEDELENSHGGGWTPLHVAICHGQVEAAKHLLKKGASHILYHGIDLGLDPVGLRHVLHVADGEPLKYDLTAMHHAARFGHTELLQFLVDGHYQEDIDCQGPYMGTPLFQAMWYGQWDETVPWFLEKGADIDRRLVETQLTPLMNFCYQRRYDEAAKLVDLGANVAVTAVHDFTILHLVLGPGGRTEDESDEEDEETPKVPKSILTEPDLVDKFIAAGFPVDAQEALMGMTPLMVASASCNVEGIKRLIAGGANVNAVDRDGLSILARLGEAAEGDAIEGLYEAGKVLLDAGASIQDTLDEFSPLNIICARQSDSFYNQDTWEKQHALLAKLLIERGVDPNAKGVSLARPVTDAIMHNNFTLATEILDCGGRPEPDEFESLLKRYSWNAYDGGKSKFIIDLDYAKYDIPRPSKELFQSLMDAALEHQVWTRVSILLEATPDAFKDMRKGLVPRCMLNATLSGDDPSYLVQTLLNQGEDPNELWENEPPLYYSIKSGYCWRSTPALVNAGANIHMQTPSMPDGAFMYSINQKYYSQALQMMTKYPHVFSDLSAEHHEQTWASLIRERGRFHDFIAPLASRPPNVYWKMAQRMMAAGLRADIQMSDGRHVRDIIKKAMPKGCYLGAAEKDVLARFDLEYDEPLSGEEDYNDVYGEDSEESLAADPSALLADTDDDSWEDYEDDDDDDDDETPDEDDDEEVDEDEDDDEYDIGFPIPMPLVFGFLM